MKMNIQCRTCLTSSATKRYQSLLNVYQNYKNETLTILDLLEIVISSKVPRSEKLPNHICTQCFSSLKYAYSFILLCKNSESFLNKNVAAERAYAIKRESGGTVEHENIIIIADGDIENYEDIERQIFGLDSDSEQKEGGSVQNDQKDANGCDERTENTRRDRVMGEIKLRDCIKGLNESQNFEEVVRDDEVTKSESNRGEKGVPLERGGKRKKGRRSRRGENVRREGGTQIVTIEDALNTSGRNRKATDIDKFIIEPGANRKPKTKRNVFGSSGQVYVCDVCEEVFVLKRTLNSHRYEVHPESCTFSKCNLCDYVAQTYSAVQHHKRKQHKGPDKACQMCDKRYLTNTQLKVHVAAVHQNKREFLCTECGKGFNYTNALAYHMRIHTGEKRYMCRYCGKKCRLLETLKRHERTHTGEKPFACRFCGDAFASRGQCKEHEHRHTGRAPYACAYCGGSYRKLYNLHVHEMQHSGTHRCDVCGRTFVHARVLKFHCSVVHKIKDVVKIE